MLFIVFLVLVFWGQIRGKFEGFEGVDLEIVCVGIQKVKLGFKVK
jgi:hypothetical protein